MVVLSWQYRYLNEMRPRCEEQWPRIHTQSTLTMNKSSLAFCLSPVKVQHMTKSSKLPSQSYSCISFTEIQSILNSADNVPPSVWPVYLVLVSYDYGFSKGNVWPKIDTIVEALGGAIPKRTVYRALAWLHDKTIIKRNSARIKGKTNTNRFVLLKRKLHKWMSSMTPNLLPNNRKNTKSDRSKPPTQGGTGGTIRKVIKKDTYRVKNGRKRFVSKAEKKRRVEQAEKERVRLETYASSAEGLFTRVIFKQPINDNQRLKLYHELTCENEFSRWAKQYNPEVVSRFLKSVNTKINERGSKTTVQNSTAEREPVS